MNRNRLARRISGTIEPGMSPWQVAYAMGLDWDNLTASQYDDVLRAWEQVNRLGGNGNEKATAYRGVAQLALLTIPIVLVGLFLLKRGKK